MASLFQESLMRSLHENTQMDLSFLQLSNKNINTQNMALKESVLFAFPGDSTEPFCMGEIIPGRSLLTTQLKTSLSLRHIHMYLNIHVP